MCTDIENLDKNDKIMNESWFHNYNDGKYGNIYWPAGLLYISKSTLMDDLSFLPLMLDISAVHLTTDDKIKLIFQLTFILLTSEC